MYDICEPGTYKIEIAIDENQNWTLIINGKEHTFAQRFSIDLQRGQKPVTYTVEEATCLLHQ